MHLIIHAVVALLARVGLGWFDFKTFLSRSTAVSHDGLHVMMGVMLQLFFATLYRSSIASVWPWLTVAALELANEWNDFHVDHWPNFGMQLARVPRTPC